MEDKTLCEKQKSGGVSYSFSGQIRGVKNFNKGWIDSWLFVKKKGVMEEKSGGM